MTNSGRRRTRRRRRKTTRRKRKKGEGEEGRERERDKSKKNIYTANVSKYSLTQLRTNFLNEEMVEMIKTIHSM